LPGANMVEYWTLPDAVAWTQAATDIITERDVRAALLRAWRNGQLEITGVKEDSDDRGIVPVLPGRHAFFVDYYQKGWALCQASDIIEGNRIVHDNLLWFRLRIRTDQCKAAFATEILVPELPTTVAAAEIEAPTGAGEPMPAAATEPQEEQGATGPSFSRPRRGRKQVERNAVVTYLREHHPNGLPATMTREDLREAMKKANGRKPSMRTVDRAIAMLSAPE